VKTINSNSDLGCYGLGSSAPSNAKGAGIMKKSKSIMLAAATAVASLLGAAAMPANASVINLSNGDSSLSINPASNAGVDNWTVDGTNQLNKEWFWFRVGSSGPQSSIDSLTLTSQTALSTNGGSNNWANVTYADIAQAFQLSVTFQLSGGQAHSGTADLAETIQITNTGTSNLSYHFFDYTSMALAGHSGGQNVSLTGLNTATQSTTGGTSQTVVSAPAAEDEAGLGTGSSFPLLSALETTSGLTLSGSTTGTDVNGEWAFEWDPILKPGQSYLITVDKQICTVPEPTSSLALLGMGGIFISRPRRRDEDPDPRTMQVAEA